MNELAASQPVLLQELKPDFSPVFRSYPDAKFSFLKNQILVPHKRSSSEPVFEGHRLVGNREGVKMNYHKLIGFGETLEAAQRMAAAKGVSV